MNTAERLHTVKEYYFSTKLREIDQLRKSGKDIINLGIGSPDLPPHETVIQALHEYAVQPNNHAYQSYKGSPLFRNAIANFYQTKYQVALNAEEEVLPLIGSKEGIMHICMTFFQQGDIVLIPNPGYPTYSSAVTLTGATTLPYNLTQEQNWQIQLQEIETHISLHGSAIKGMFINSPHMPTGSLLQDDCVQQLISLCIQHNILLIHDNPYSFILNNNPKSLLGLPHAKEIMIELNSLSKSHNMAGWRVGMLCGKKAFVDDILRFKSNMDSGMFLPLQMAAANALQLGMDWFTGLNEIYIQRRAVAYKIFDCLGLQYETNQVGMFLWAKISSSKDGYALSNEVLYNTDVFITPGGIFGTNGNNYLRISLCSKQEVLEKALERIQQFKQ
jgi:LL-diaminopimelate aminotransferase